MTRLLRWATALAAMPCIGGVILHAGPPYHQVGPPDRVSATNFLVIEGSSIELRDMNNDGFISDADVALLIYDQLIASHGQDLQVGDLDGDGAVTGEDVIEAIAALLRASFGKVIPDEQPVGPGDVLAVVDGVMTASPTADLNLDGSADTGDIAVVITNIELDLAPLTHEIGWVARGLYEYIGVIRERGREFFMAEEPVEASRRREHAVIISDEWPSNHPSWWPPNHRRNVSETIKPEYPRRPPWMLQPVDPAWPPLPSEHARSISGRWPANHDLWFSQTWEGFDHDLELSVVPGQWPNPTLPRHVSELSKHWPPNHAYQLSRSWPAEHFQVNSRVWWPMHVWSDSSQRRFPPMHSKWTTDHWSHDLELSRSIFPPNHLRMVSASWPMGHQQGVSVHYPPNHISYISSSWPGPQPQWPSNHARELSEQWSNPAPPAGWPLFPRDHSWFTTFSLTPGIVPRNPWAAQP